MKRNYTVVTILLSCVIIVSCATTEKKVGCVEGKCDEGYGVYVWEDGSKYAGSFKSAKFHGQGTFT